MTKRTTIHPVAFVAISLMMFQTFHASAQTDQNANANTPTFNFSYRIAGDRGAAPLQAFDDGKKTHLQFRDLTSVPAMFADTPAGRILLKAGTDYDIQPPFVVLHHIEPELMLVMNKRKAFVSYKGQPTQAVVQTPAMYGAKQPVTMSGSISAPQPAEVLASRPGSPKKEPSSELAGNPKESVSLASSLGAGETVIAAPSGKPVVSKTEPVTQPAEPSPAQEWKITSADKNVRTLLERWSKEAKEARYQILWEVPRDLELGAITSVSGTFEDALDSVLLSLVDSEYPIEAVMYDGNNVVRIVKHIPGNK